MPKMINESVEYIRSKTSSHPKVAMILGTGLNTIAEMMEDPTIIPYKDIPNMKVSTAPSHAGKLVSGKLSGKNVIIMQGRLHFYEGYSMQEITFSIRMLKMLGIERLIITNAAGSLRENYKPGNIILLEDHINMMGTNPLIGKNLEKFGERFPSLHEPYSLALIKKCEKIAANNDFEVKRGVYCAVTGPSLETRSECKMFQSVGADLVGMSTVPEVIVAVHSGMEVLGISVVTNYSNIFHSKAHSQEEIRKNADIARNNIEKLIKSLLEKI